MTKTFENQSMLSAGNFNSTQDNFMSRSSRGFSGAIDLHRASAVAFNPAMSPLIGTLPHKKLVDDNMDAWKVMIKDDVNRFQIENEQKR
jgi:hypothetical protein